MDEQVTPSRRGATRAALRHARRWALRLLVAVLASTLLSAPLAFSWAVSHTEVRDRVGTSPTTFSLTTSGHSELHLGIAGTVFVPVSRGPFGMVASVEGPGDPGTGEVDLAAYAQPEMLKLYTGLFHNPEVAITQYVDLLQAELRRQLLLAWLVFGVGGGVLLLVLSRLLRLRASRRREDVVRVGLACAVLLVASTGAAYGQLRGPGPGSDAAAGRYQLPILDGTLAAGSTTNSPVLRALLGGALEKSRQLIERQEQQAEEFQQTAEQGLEEQAEAMVGPGPGELAVMMQSDMHCNTSMIALQTKVASMLRERFGDDVPALLGITGDLTTNGTAAEGSCIRKEARINGDDPVAAVTGNHESEVSAEQMDEAGMTVLDGETEEVGGVDVLGDGDPERSELFGATRLRDDETLEEMGARLREEALSGERPDLVLVHQAYAAASFLEVDSVSELLKGQQSLTEPTTDEVPDVPASAVFYGHWHRSVPPRVVWNSDGTWTLVMELDTTGGAVDEPTIGRFSTPWSRPLQAASFPVVFLDEETGLVTGYQIYRFDIDGTVTIEPRQEVGPPVADGAEDLDESAEKGAREEDPTGPG